ncbi:MAG: hypothetical protein AAGC74_00870 [Verrucomicrobiota bacterium]
MAVKTLVRVPVKEEFNAVPEPLPAFWVKKAKNSKLANSKASNLATSPTPFPAISSNSKIPRTKSMNQKSASARADPSKTSAKAATSFGKSLPTSTRPKKRPSASSSNKTRVQSLNLGL